jgi:GNAT superfamily N-acetyltransferase
VTDFRIEKLATGHVLDEFDCGNAELNRYLVRHALQNQGANAAQTYLALADDAVIGFYTLVVGEVAFDVASERLTKGLARHPVPVMLLARLAVSNGWQGRSVGAGLLKDAAERTMSAADIAGIRALVVHAKDDKASRFYQHFGLAPAHTDPLHLFVLLKDLRRMHAAPRESRARR